MAQMNGQAMGVLLIHLKTIEQKVLEIYLQTRTPLSPWQVQDILQQVRVWECTRKGVKMRLEVDVNDVQMAILKNTHQGNLQMLAMTRTGRDGKEEHIWTLNKKKFPAAQPAEQRSIF